MRVPLVFPVPETQFWTYAMPLPHLPRLLRRCLCSVGPATPIAAALHRPG